MWPMKHVAPSPETMKNTSEEINSFGVAKVRNKRYAINYTIRHTFFAPASYSISSFLDGICICGQ